MSTTRAIREWLARHRQRLSAIVLRGFAQLVTTVPPLLVLNQHGASGFGLFSIFVAVAGLSVVLEWGLPQKLQNEISRGQRVDAYDRHWLLRDSGFVRHLAVNIPCTLGLWYVASLGLGHWLPAEMALQLNEHSAALLAMFLVAGGIGASYHARSIVFGLGHIDKGIAFSLAGAGVSLLLVVIGIAAQASIAVLAVIAAAAPLLERLIAAGYCFGRARAIERHRSMPPPLSAQAAVAARQKHVAPMFLYLQVLALFANNIDALYAARGNSLRSVGEYAFLVKLYGVPLLIANTLSSAALPRLAVQAHDGRTGGSQTVFALMRSNAAIVVPAGLIIVLGAGLLYRWITGIEADLRALAALMLVDATVLAMRGVLTAYVNAAEVLWLNVIGNTVFSAAAIVLKVVLVDHAGIFGLVTANILAYVFFLLPFHLAALTRIARRERAKAST